MTRIGVAGAGLIGKRHIEAMAQVAEVTLSGVLDPALPEDSDLPRVTDMAALVKCSDGIILATPNHLHLPMAEAALRGGCPVLIEKPLADTVSNGARIVEIEAETGVPVLVGHHRRHNPMIAAAKQIVDSGRLGPITSVHGTTWLPKPDSYYEQAWRQAAGAGPLFINLIHDIDLLMHLCGPIVQVQAYESNIQRGAGAEEVAVAVLRFSSGTLGTVNLSDVSLGPWSWELTAGENPAYHQTDQSAYLIGGRLGSLSIPNLTVWSQDDGPDWWQPIDRAEIAIDDTDPLVAQIAHFRAVIAGEVSPLVSARDGLRAVEVVDAIKRAAQSGRAVDIG